MRVFRVALPALLLVLSASAEDVVHMTNGDRLTGEIQRLHDGSLLLDTPYAGTITLDWASVANVETATPVVLELADAPAVAGRLRPDADRQGIETDAGWREVDLASVTAVTSEAAAAEAAEEVPEATANPWSGSATAGLTLRSGNTDTLDIAMAIEAKRERERDTLTLGLSGAYGKAEDVLNTRRHTLDAKWQYYPHERLYIFGQGLEEQDDGRKLDLRVRATAGLGYDFIDTERTHFSGDLGLSHTWEDWAAYTPAERDAARTSVRDAGSARLRTLALGLGDGSVTPTLQTLRDVAIAVLDIRSPLRGAETRSEQFMNLQLGLYFEQKLFEHSVLTEEFVAHPSLEDFGEVQLSSQLAFVTPLRERLDLRIALESAYDSTADESDVDAWDQTFITGLRYGF